MLQHQSASNQSTTNGEASIMATIQLPLFGKLRQDAKIIKCKVCFKCGKLKPLDGFYKHSKMADGHLNKCKECNKKDVSKNYRKNIDHYKEYERKRHQGPERKAYNHQKSKEWHRKNKERSSEMKKEWENRNPEKRKASHLVGNALRSGRLQKQPCAICGKTDNVQGHHFDYDKPLEVIWLCIEHHNMVHMILSERTLVAKRNYTDMRLSA